MPEQSTEPLVVSGAGDDFEWHDAVAADSLWSGDLLGLEIDDAKVLLVNVDGQIRGYEDRCPHQSSLLSEGILDGSALTCSTHLWVFDAVTGEGVNPQRACLKEYPVEVRNGEIFVGLPRRL
ncbi:MAG: toluene monooxygenase system ferredoxin subunit [Ilumatobacteraceae bacterium]